MKRKEIIKTIDKAGELLDHVDGAVIKNPATGEFLEGGALTKEEIQAMQTALVVCIKLIEANRQVDPLHFAIKLVALHAAAKNDLFADEDTEPDEGGDAE